MPRNPFATDTTKYDTFKVEPTGAYEFACHKAWRVREQMTSLSRVPVWPSKDEIIERLKLAQQELVDCIDILEGRATDKIGFFDEKNKTEVQGYKDT
jgi:hypothetical protein